jgi:cell division transport system permease protein
MALRVDYVTRETANNLRRNLLMTSAAVLTVAVSLALVGGALLFRQGVQNATVQWRGGVELNIFLKPEATQAQTDAVQRQLDALPQVKRVRYCDKQCAFAEFKSLFANEPEFQDAVTADDLPPSFRVVPTSPELTEQVGRQFVNRPGVYKVKYAEKEIKTLLNVTKWAQRFILAIALILLLSAAVLILNTIRMAIYSRRREVAVMKLVGATNWFIRVPFMFEGLVQGLSGAALAFGAVVLGRNLLLDVIRNNDLLKQFYVSSGEVFGTGIMMILVGVIVGAVGSAVAVNRFLDV